jgi:hypothetical protein
MAIIAGSGSVIDLTGPRTGHLITVDSGVTLTLINVTLKGLNKDIDNNPGDTVNNDRSLIKVNDGGKLILGYGAVIMDNNNANISEDNEKYGGGVRVFGGQLLMESGSEISGNKTARRGGGGVFVGVNAEESKASSFTMEGGTISHNIASGDGSHGGGVYIDGTSTFIMESGTISYNEAASSGGGVGMGNSFTMKGGTISYNVSKGQGGGDVSMWNPGYGLFTMEGGTISNNTATAGTGNGGGVYVEGANFDMDASAIIKSNMAKQGGGVYVSGAEEPYFNMKDGTISDNTAIVSGGGVYGHGNSIFTMKGGTISGNKAEGTTASNGGGGGYGDGSSNFTMEGGIIRLNTALNGGGVYMASGIFHKTVPSGAPGGIIYGTGDSLANTATDTTGTNSSAIRLGNTDDANHRRSGTHNEYLELEWPVSSGANEGSDIKKTEHSPSTP